MIGAVSRFSGRCPVYRCLKLSKIFWMSSLEGGFTKNPFTCPSPSPSLRSLDILELEKTYSAVFSATRLLSPRAFKKESPSISGRSKFTIIISGIPFSCPKLESSIPNAERVSPKLMILQDLLDWRILISIWNFEIRSLSTK